MKPGSVVVDLAAETGGNVEGSVAGEVVRIGNAQVWGGRNVPSQMPGPASRLYAQNVVNLVTLMTESSEDEGGAQFAPDFDDEIVTGSCVTHDGAIRHEPTRERPGRGRPVSEPIVWLTIFVLSVFVGIEVISKVSSTLHTPLMSGANAIHGIILLGAIIVTGTTDNTVALVVGLVAIVLAAINMVGGFVVTDRMLQMFVRKKKRSRARPTEPARPARPGVRHDSHLGPADLPRLRGLLHPRAQGPLRAEDRPDRQPHRGRWRRSSPWPSRSSTSTSTTSR